MVDIFNINQNLLDFIKTRCIGITGSIASGKSYIGSILKEEGFIYIDSDSLAKSAYLEESLVFPQIIDILNRYRLDKNIEDKKAFLIDKLLGDSLHVSKRLNTKLLVELFMMDRTLFKEVEKVIHLYVKDCFCKIVDNIREKQLEQNKEEFFFYESALLIETGWYKNMFKNILITCSLEERIHRMNERGYPSRKVFDFLSEYQMLDEIKMGYCDIVIDSKIDKKELKKILINTLKDNSIIL